MKIGICQCKIKYEDKAFNLKAAESVFEHAAKEKTALLLFPEMSFTGFSMNVQKTGENSMETVEAMKTMAVRYGMAVGFGWVKGQKNSENHFTVIDEQGILLGDYVKIHPFSYARENRYFAAGDTLCQFVYQGINFGITICYDLRFPEVYQKLSETCDVIITAANWPKKRMEHWDALLKARAIENQVYMIGINCVGMQGATLYKGHSQVISPDGKILLELGEKETAGQIVLNNDTAEYRNAFPVKSDRRKQLYQTWYAEESTSDIQ